MCLTTNMTEPAVAENDIHVLKVLLRDTFYYGRLYSPYKGMEYKLGFTYSAVLGALNPYYNGGGEVNSGLHTFGLEEQAHFEERIHGIGAGLYHAIIPKGALYYKGTFGRAVSYVSDRLIVTEKVEDW